MAFKSYLPDPEGEFPAAAPDYFFYMLHQTARRRDAAIDAALEPMGLNASRARTLTIIRRLEGCSMNALAKFTTIERTTLTREVDLLVARGLIERTVPANDRRRVSLSLTAQGEAVYESGVPLVLEATLRALEGVDGKALREFARMLRTIMLNLVDDADWANDLISYARPDGKKAVRRQG
jgi:MarR family transcriptional regulator, lower aerobic nicotinate degradation pathway regulator